MAAGAPEATTPAHDSIPSDTIRSQLERLLASPILVNSTQLCRFLRHAVERTLAGDAASLKENLLGTDVFERGIRFDPRTDPVVRVEARRLRAKLEEYYKTIGAGDEIVIRMVKGSYVPAFERRAENGQASAAARERTALPFSWSRRTWLTAGASALAILVATVATYLWFHRAGRTEGPAAVAVLPFANVGPDPETEYFADGLTDELIDILGHTEGVRVVARSSVFQYKGRTGDARGIAHQLNAVFLLEGSVRRDAGRLRVTAQLVDARNGYQLWSDTLERDWTQVFAIQDEIARSIVSKLRARSKVQRSRGYTENLESYNAYLKGRYYWNKRTLSGFESAIAAFSQAIDKDPNYAPAWAGLADSYCMLGFMNAAAPYEIRQKGAQAADRALQLDEGLAEAHVARGNLRAIYDWDWERAIQSFHRALELDPDSAEAHYSLSKTLASIGRLGEAIPEMQRAQELDPLSLMTITSLGWELAVARRYQEADKAFQSARELDPNFIWAYTLQAWSYEARGQSDRAVASLRRAVELSGSSTVALGELAHALGGGGHREEASQIVSKLSEDAKRQYVSPFDLSRAYEGLGRRDEAMAALARAADERSAMIVFVKADPVFDPLRSDARFVALLKRMRLN